VRIRAGQLLLATGLVPAFAGIATHTTWAEVISPETVGPGGNFTSLAAAAASEVAGNSYTFNLIAGTTFTDTQAFAVFAADTTINGNGDTLQATHPPSNEKGVLTTTWPRWPCSLREWSAPGSHCAAAASSSAATMSGATQ
jgi:hypothetical protein